MRRWGVLLALCLAGPLWAGEAEAEADVSMQAWVAEYQLHDAHGDRSLVVVRSENRIEYRTPGEPIRVWQQGSDGLEHREIFPADQRVIVYAPGDLRALGYTQDWAKLSGLVDPALRGQLKEAGSARIAGEPAQRFRGGQDGARIELAWLAVPALPARYRRDAAQGGFELTLRKLERRPAAKAFTVTDGYRELDYTDIGDMELDPFARRYIQQGF